jgi:capsular polysaccharide export protein
MLLLLQLESDSQMLVHSPFSSNQSLISRLEKQAKKLGLRLVIKKHPLDFNEYELGKNSQYVNGSISPLSDQAELVITVNSSASVDVLKTKTPLFLLGESIYDHVGVAQKTTINEVYNTYKEIKANKSVSTWRRKQFIHYLKKSYLTKGAGFSFCDKVLDAKLNELAESSREHIKTTQEARIALVNKIPPTLKSTL